MKEKLYAVITGDVAKSSRFAGEEREKLLVVLKKAFSTVEDVLGTDIMAFPFEIFRGDSFQGVIRKPELSLKAVVLIRASIRSSFKTTLKDSIDARLAIGIGTIDFLPVKNSGEGDGEAYRNSGPALDTMSKHSRMIIINTPNKAMNDELNVECAMLDTIISRWTAEQADAIIETLKGKTQEEMAEMFTISQPAVKKRVDSSNFYAFQLMLKRFNNLLAPSQEHISNT